MQKKLTLILLTFMTCVFHSHAGLGNLSLKGLEVEGEFLWWKGQADNLYIVSRTSEFTDSEFTDTYWELGYSPGYRLGLAYPVDQCGNGLELYATYTYFRSNDTQTYNVSVGANEGFTINSPLINLAAIPLGDPLEYSGSVNFQYNRVDIGFARTAFNYDALIIIPKVAFTYVHTQETLAEDALNGGFVFINRAKDTYNGYGATVGFDTNYAFGACSGLSLYSSVEITGLWGNFDFSLTSDTIDDITDLPLVLETFGNSEWIGRWMSDVKIGLQYQTSFFGCYQLGARIGWEFVYLPDQSNFFTTRDPGAVKISGLTAGLALGF